MQDLLTLVRALHFASLFSLAGALAFAAFVAEPAFRRHADQSGVAAFRRRLLWICWPSLALALLSGFLWLVLEARSMSGRPLADVFSQGLLAVVLERTRFGHDWALRGLLAVALVACLVLVKPRPRNAIAWPGFWAALVLSAAELAMLAGAGHAAAGTGWPGYVQLVGDGVHLLAAGVWVGGLLPLALLFAAARGDEDSSCALAAREATFRFSSVGVAAVGMLLATGLLNTVFLVGSVPALLGTEYGHLLLLKIALFLTMVAFAAINREWLAPQLSGVPAASAAGANRDTLRQLERNALIEAGLGAAVLIVLGKLGTTAPALHVQPEWPLPFSLSFAAIEALPDVRLKAILTGGGAILGLAVLAYGLLLPRRRTLQILVGLFLFLALGWLPFQYMVVPAYPTSFYRSPVPLTAQSIVKGAQVYADDCSACHGTSGRGDGPLARNMPVAPADLTAGHLFAHSEGDLFWWVSRGIPEGGMPGFAETLDDRARWDVINFIRARAAAVQPLALLPEVTANPAPPAPDFAFDQGGQQETLHEASEEESVLLVLYRLPSSRARLQQLAAAEHDLAAAGLRLLAVPIDAKPADAEVAGPLPDFAANTGADTAAAYALFEGAERIEHCEFLVDRAGFLRARWKPGTPPGLPDPAALMAQVERAARLPLQEQTHVHAH